MNKVNKMWGKKTLSTWLKYMYRNAYNIMLFACRTVQHFERMETVAKVRLLSELF